jgi:hypothetical protein
MFSMRMIGPQNRYKTQTSFGVKNQEFTSLRWKTPSARHSQISISKAYGFGTLVDLTVTEPAGKRAKIAVSVVEKATQAQLPHHLRGQGGRSSRVPKSLEQRYPLIPAITQMLLCRQF